jgi:hypothetical protein
MEDHEIRAFTKGTHNLVSDELIPADAASDSSNWYTQDGRIKLIPGRLRIGAEGAVGSVKGQMFGYKADGTKVHWRKVDTKIQYFNGMTWTDVVTGLTASADYTFANYSSLAGTFTYAFGADGIYKFHNASPGSYISLYNSAKNFKGHAIIDRGRAILWNRAEDRTGLYGSKIDRQDATVYTTVTAENIGSGDGATLAFSGTLAFKAGGATRNCFGVSITVTSGETFTDNYRGTLTGSAGGTGTINYITGAWTLTCVVAPANAANNIKATYQWEDSNTGGITDFTKSATRVSGEGFVFPQDEGGDAILDVLIGQDGAYYSLKSQSAYRLELEPTDLSAENLVYRRNMGVPARGAAVSTGKGVVFMNTANPEKPELTILVKDPVGGDTEPAVLFPHFRFADYVYTDCKMATYERYVLVACRTSDASANDTILLCDLANGTVDVTRYNARTFASDAGYLYIGSSITDTVYQLYSGCDDDGEPIQNHWIGKGELFGTSRLKKRRILQLKGRIQPDQYYEVYCSYDDAGYQLVGTVRGDGPYVDNAEPQVIGNDIIGSSQIGADVESTVFPYFTELKLKAPKFRKRKLKFVAKGIGYLDIETLAERRLVAFESKLPRRFRVKQNVSLDGESTDQSDPEY